MSYYLGIDIGTSAVKAVLVDQAQGLCAQAEQPLSISRPHPMWSEQNPQDWWGAVERILMQLQRYHGAAIAGVAGIGLSGQMHGAVLLGADLQPLRPAILWNDARSSAQANALAQQYPGLAAIVGVLPMSGLTAPKLPWLARHEPHVLAKLHKLMLPKDYIRLQLTGDCVTDMSDAAGTWLLDEAKRDWCAPALAAVNLQRSQLPRLVEGNAASGILRPEIAQRFGFLGRVVVAGGAGDAAAGAIGIGAIRPGDAFLSLGTSGQMFVSTADYRPAPETMIHAFCHALPQRWLQMGAMLSAAGCLTFAQSLFQCAVSDLLEEANHIVETPSSLLFLPYLTGERTPHNDPNARGVLFGLTPGTSRGEVVRAIMEGVAFSFADASDCLLRSGTVVTQAGVIGGGARSTAWLQIIANVLGITLVRYKTGARGPAFGAARLARLAHLQEDPDALCTPPEVEDTITPDLAQTRAYAPRLARYRSLYRALKSEFEAHQH